MLHCRRRDDPALGCATECGVVVPFFEISRLKEFTDEAEKPSVVNLLCQRSEQNLVIQTVKAGSYVSLKVPSGAEPCAVDIL